MRGMEPAQTIIKLCGGPKEVAAMTGRDVTRVHRWTYPKDKGGTGGLIPTDVQERLLEEAHKRGVGLTPSHFFPNFKPEGAGK